MTYETIRYAVEDGIATITLNRPDKLNAFNGRMIDDLLGAFDRIDADDVVRVAIVTGAGRAFCAGADLSDGAGSFALENDADDPPRDGGGQVTLRIFQCKKPVIAAINGAAVGVGITMTLAMDIRMASAAAKIGFVFAKRGIVPEAASSWFLPRIVGIAKALEWCFTGRVFPASEALAGGLVHSVHAPDDLVPAARALAREMADATAPVSIAMTRQMLWRGLGMAHPMEAHRVDSRGIDMRGRSADVAEGVASFLEKRPATFPDRVSSDMPDYFPWWKEPRFIRES